MQFNLNDDQLFKVFSAKDEDQSHIISGDENIIQLDGAVESNVIDNDGAQLVQHSPPL